MRARRPEPETPPALWRSAAPHADDHAAMCYVLEATIRACGRGEALAPQRLFECMQAAASQGDTPGRVSAAGCWAAHWAMCRTCRLDTRMSIQLERCPVARSIAWLTAGGAHPGDLWVAPPPPGLSPSRAYPVEESARPALQRRFAQLVEDGLANALSAREVRDRLRRADPVASAFVVTKWSPLDHKGVGAGFRAWAARRPRAAVEFLTSARSASPPASLCKRKDRVVFDLASVNEATAALPFVYPDLARWLCAVDAGSHLIVADVKDGFTSLPVADGAKHLFTVLGDRAQPLELRRVPFGWAAAPFLFCIVSGLLTQSLRRALPSATIMVYMDDLLVAMPPLQAPDAVEEIRDQFGQLGLLVSEPKLQGPAPEVEYLGFRLSSESAGVMVSFPEAKRAFLAVALGIVVDQLERGTARLPKRAFAAVVSQLRRPAELMVEGRARLAPLYREMGGHAFRFRSWNATLTLSGRARSALAWFADRLGRRTSPGLLTGLSPLADGSRLRLFGATDASGDGGMGGFVVDRDVGAHAPRVAWAWTRRVGSTRPGADEGRGLATAWEVAALFWQGLAAAAVRDKLRPAAPVLLESLLDSQAAAAIVRKGYSLQSAPITEMCRALALLQERLRVRVVLRWERRRWNWQADRLSHPETVELSSLGTPPTSVSELIGEDDESQGPPGIWRSLELGQATGGNSDLRAAVETAEHLALLAAQVSCSSGTIRSSERCAGSHSEG